MAKQRKENEIPKRRATATASIADFVAAMESLAPTRLAQSWDNVGLLAGDPTTPLRRVLLCIDLTRAVVDEAIKSRADLVMAYHPPIFKPINTLRADSTGTDALVFRCIANGIAIYSTHTALDAADGGTNDVLVSLCGITQTEPLEYVDDPFPAGQGGLDAASMRRVGTAHQFKLVVFVPASEVDAVAGAMFNAGAGHIGDYANCSYRLDGQGTFLGGASTNPTVGGKGRMEYVDEVRLETVVPGRALPAVVSAMIQAHSYEEPAYDIYPLKPRPLRGIGRVGSLPKPASVVALARSLKRKTAATCVQIVGDAQREVDRAIIIAGAAGSLPFKMNLTPRDAIITGEIRHHDALTIRRLGCPAIALGHWSSERPVLDSLANRLELFTGVIVKLSNADRDPFLVP